jgi:hypothetical protein
MYTYIYIHTKTYTHIHIHMHTNIHTGTMMSGYIKALIPSRAAGGGGGKYAQFTIQELPADGNAAGIRHGACQMLADLVPLEHCLAVSGHDATNHSALYEYLDNSIQKNMPGAIVLSGWPALPWGQLGRGPVPACMETLQVCVKIYVHVHLYELNLCVYVCMHVCMVVYARMYVYGCMCVCVYTEMCIYKYVCM